MARTSPSLDELLSRAREERFLGNFQLVKQLGTGGFAPVWLANELYGTSVLRSVAIKLFAPGDGRPSLRSGSRGSARSSPPGSLRSGAPGPMQRGDPESMRSESQGSVRSRSLGRQHSAIVEEARALIRVEHPNVVRFHTIATDPDSSVIGLVMEYLQGKSLAREIEMARTLPAADVVTAGCAIASALAAAHRVGVVHRDVKPLNVINVTGTYKLIDFGIAAAGQNDAPPERREKPAIVICDDLPLEALNTKMTAHTEQVRLKKESSASSPWVMAPALGTVGYMDPSSLAGPPTPASDLYSLGALLYETLCGSLPAIEAARRAGKSGMSGDVLSGAESPPSIADVAPQTPAALASLVDRLLDPDPQKRPASAEAASWEFERVRREISGVTRNLPPEERGPFRGLGRFDQEDHDVYFGRSVEIAASLEMLRARGLLALVGPSGSGKSSLARAGVVPAVLEGRLGSWPGAWDVALAFPGNDPRKNLLEALSGVVEYLPQSSPDALLACLASRVHREGRGMLVVIDQLEELVTLARDEMAESRQFVLQFLFQAATAATPGIRCVVTARRDLLDPLLALNELGSVLTRGSVLVSPMSVDAWSDVIDQALAAYGYSFEDAELRDGLLAQLDTTWSAMPLVQFALAELWSRRDRRRKIIPRSALVDVGGIAGALQAHAEAKRAALIAEEESLRYTIYKVLMALTTAQGTRAILSPKALYERDDAQKVDRVVEEFEHSRLLMREGDGITIAHESLLTQWERLRGWIAEARSDRTLAEEIERETEMWQLNPTGERLWRGRRLLAAEEVQRHGRVALSEGAQRFVAKSKWAVRRTKALGFTLALLVFGSTATGVTLYVRAVRAGRARAETAQRDAEAARRKAQASEKVARKAEAQAKRSEERAILAEKTAKYLRKRYQEQFEKLQAELAESNRNTCEQIQLRVRAEREQAADAKFRRDTPNVDNDMGIDFMGVLDD